ncbi:hypothetical protein EMPS_08045 [Entomortierella parvispora]|uniref:JmjC domain-containing protein n=1 Tax=Entomortierella parvispora TaxID=205924 RepID=A0A9P3HFI0_9FUNG|nr:hypothetical protein EMPS_08045 [Entomortierella parvispora]
MQAAANPEGKAQTLVDLSSMNFQNIIAMGYPFEPIKRIDVITNEPQLRSIVEDICVKKGTPVVLENFHLRQDWDKALFTFSYLDEMYSNKKIQCRDLANAQDVEMSMGEYIRQVHPVSFAQRSKSRNAKTSPDLPSKVRNRDMATTDSPRTDIEHSTEVPIKASTSPCLGQVVAGALCRPVEADLVPCGSFKCNDSSNTRGLVDEIKDGILLQDPQLSPSYEMTYCASATEPSPTSPRPTVSSLLNIKPGSTDSEAISPSEPVSLDPLIYAKDLTCPKTWRRYLDEFLPNWLVYMAGNDLMSNVDPKFAAENLMVYIGQAGTWTPTHVDQCGSIGHNIMAWADDDSSSIWFMVKTEDREKARALWASIGEPIDYEGYFATVDHMKLADFPIYVVEQKIGDFVMVPSMSYHQVVNLGKATIKISWNRQTADCLKSAINFVLPRYKEIGRTEGYRISLVIQSSLREFTMLLRGQERLPDVLPEPYFMESFKDLLELYRIIVEDEWIEQSEGSEFNGPRRVNGSTPAVCDFCFCDIWNRHFRCSRCAYGEDDYDTCLRCFARGRGCIHRASKVDFIESFSMGSLQELFSDAIEAWNDSQILASCVGYEKLLDPWINGIIPSYSKSLSPATLAYKRRQLLKASSPKCHRCNRVSQNIVTIQCIECGTPYCESCLFERYNIAWHDVAGRREPWICPRCTGECLCRKCDKEKSEDGIYTPPDDPPKIMPLWFLRPDDDYRNRGGVMDFFMSREFASVYELDQGSDMEWDAGQNKKRLLTEASMMKTQEPAKTAKKVCVGIKSRALSREPDRPEMTEVAFLRGLGLTSAEEAETTTRVQWMVKTGMTRSLSSLPLSRGREQRLDRSFYENLFTTDLWMTKQGRRPLDHFRYTTLVQLAEGNALGSR